MEKDHSKDRTTLSASFKVGSIALAFLIIGYQTAIFIRNAAILRIESNKDHPDTVFIVSEELVSIVGNDSSIVLALDNKAYPDKHEEKVMVKKSSGHSEIVETIRKETQKRHYESFPFDPNTVSVGELQRLGFSEKQAQAIENYRSKGGRFRRSEDFQKSFVVSDSIYRRLEAFINIPKIDINSADSAAFDSLPGIGAYYASRMVRYRQELGGYSYPEQLMDIKGIDVERYDGFKDLISIGEAPVFKLWSLDEEGLVKHPYIDKSAAHGIIIFRENNPIENWTVNQLINAGIIDSVKGDKLSRCRIEKPIA